MSKAPAYAQLVRLPNVFTALADIGLGLFATCGVGGAEPDGRFWISAALLLTASACLYSAGMIWNDVFDVEEDRRDRPFRPLPSGRVSLWAARLMGTVLLSTGFVLAVLAGVVSGTIRPAIVAALLVVAILFYDAGLKRTPAGPVGMGACRFLNVLLGMSLLPGQFPAWVWVMASAVGVYIAGVTLLARDETGTSERQALPLGALVMVAGLVLAASVPNWRPTPSGWPALGVLAVAAACLLPLEFFPPRPLGAAGIQRVVKRSILGLIVLDAALAFALAGPVGLTLLLLLPPAVVLGRWVYST